MSDDNWFKFGEDLWGIHCSANDNHQFVYEDNNFLQKKVTLVNEIEIVLFNCNVNYAHDIEYIVLQRGSLRLDLYGHSMEDLAPVIGGCYGVLPFVLYSGCKYLQCVCTIFGG